MRDRRAEKYGFAWGSYITHAHFRKASIQHNGPVTSDEKFPSASLGETLHRQKPIKKVLFLQNVAQFLGLIFDKKVYCQKGLKITFSVYFLASLAF